MEVGCSNILKVVRVVFGVGVRGGQGMETEPGREQNPVKLEHEMGEGEKVL